MADRLITTVGEVLHVIAPAWREILTADELAATRTRVVQQPNGHSMRTLEQ